MKPQTAEQINEPKRVSLELAKTNLAALSTLGGSVRIYSAEHRAYWRPMGEGYTFSLGDAGIYETKEAFNRAKHCGPEKGIVFEAYTLPNEELDLRAEARAVELAAMKQLLAERDKLKAALKEGVELMGLLAATPSLMQRWADEAKKLL